MSISEAEQKRLEICATEPIRRPGSIQPHGVLLGVRPEGMTIGQVSANTGELLGVEPEALLDSSLTALLPAETVGRIDAVLAGSHGAANPIPVVVHERQFDALVHQADGMVVVELEPVLPAEDFGSAPMLYAEIKRLTAATTREQLWSETAEALHSLTGYDRVMIYHFHPDEHGEVVAEVRADDMEPYLGLHYPASDIPAQARQLYLSKLSRTIVSSEPVSCGLVPERDPKSGEPLDLSGAELRSVSPHHLEFMRNMGQESTLSLSLIAQGRLVGMITCAHRTTRRLPYTLRQGLEVLANQVAMQLSSMAEIERLTRAAAVRDVRRTLIEQFAVTGDLASALLHQEVTLLEVVHAAGAVISVGGETATLGSVPPDDQVAALTDYLPANVVLPFESDALPIEYPELAELVPGHAGLLVVPFGGEGDYVMWFRPELIETVQWLGDQTEANRDSTLSPRNSFSAWGDSVAGRSQPWAGLESEAIEFGRDLDSALMRRTESTLAHLGLHDALTGLANRRLLMDRLEQAVQRVSDGGDVSLLFVDVDSFKSINDELGHETGDALLRGVAARLVSAMRATDTVARLGGDEFVVLADGSSEASASMVAERVLTALRRPFYVGTRELSISASVGVATADAEDSPSSLLRKADQAMYRAKRAGKDRLAVS